MRKFVMLTAGLTAILLVGVSPAPGSSDPDRSPVQSIRQRLIDASLAPSPLFPDRIPAKIARQQADLTLYGNNFYVSFHNCPRGTSACRLLVDYSRLKKSALKQLKKMVRTQQHKLHRVRINGQKAIYAKSDVTFFYAWRAQHHTYYVGSHYFGSVKRRDLRTMVASVRPLPRG